MTTQKAGLPQPRAMRLRPPRGQLDGNLTFQLEIGAAYTRGPPIELKDERG
jgi:hypothetical protein